MTTEKDIYRNEEIILKYRKTAMFFGIILWIAIISLSIIGTILINWTIIPISIFTGLLLGLYIGHRTNKKIMNETGLDLKTQQAIWRDKFYGKHEKSR